MTTTYYMIESCGEVEGLFFNTIEEAKKEIFNRLNTYGYEEGMTTKDYVIIEQIRTINRIPL